MFFLRTEAVTTWIAPALLGAVLGLLAYMGIDPPNGTPFLALLFALTGMFILSLSGYGFRRFLLRKAVRESDDEASE